MNPPDVNAPAPAPVPPDLFMYTVKSIGLVAAFGTFMYLLGKRAR